MSMNIRILGAHNCESLDTRMASLLIDEVLAIDAGGLTSSLSQEAQARLKAVLITHHHYDHVRDIPALAMNFSLQRATINIYATPPVRETIVANLLNGKLYPKFQERPPEKPAINFIAVEPYRPELVAGYDIRAVPVSHVDSSVGYQVTSPDGKAVFYTADTGPGLSGCWEHISPQLLIIDVSVPNRYEEYARESKHLTPALLKQELISFRKLRGYLPRVVTVHMNPSLEKEIAVEIVAVAEALSNPVTLAHEGMQLHL